MSFNGKENRFCMLLCCLKCRQMISYHEGLFSFVKVPLKRNPSCFLFLEQRVSARHLIQYHLASKHKPLLHFEEKEVKESKKQKQGGRGGGGGI